MGSGDSREKGRSASPELRGAVAIPPPALLLIGHRLRPLHALDLGGDLESATINLAAFLLGIGFAQVRLDDRYVVGRIVGPGLRAPLGGGLLSRAALAGPLAGLRVALAPNEFEGEAPGLEFNLLDPWMAAIGIDVSPDQEGERLRPAGQGRLAYPGLGLRQYPFQRQPPVFRGDDEVEHHLVSPTGHSRK